MNNVITFIHGTFAKDAPWTQPDSPFTKKLVENLKEQVTFESFTWSGKNSHTARMKAAESLAARLKEQIEKSPHARKIIIAHSHGGNIALYALKILKEQASNFQLITLATPFLNTEKRKVPLKIESYVIRLTILFFAFPALILVLAAGYLLNPLHHLNGRTLTIGFIAISYLLLISFTKNIHAKLQRAAVKLPARLEDIMSDFSFDGLYERPIFVIFHPQDKVRGWVSMFRPVWDLLIKVHISLLEMSNKIIRLVFVGLMALSLVMVLYGTHFPPWLMPILRLIQLLILYGFVFYMVVPLTGLLLSTFLYGIKSNRLFLGFESPVHQLFVKTIISNEPLSFKNISSFQVDDNKPRPFSLNHSIYELEIIFPKISEWIETHI
jgi:hypothetical protein